MNLDTLFTRSKPAVGKRGVHLDLKGLPPTPQRFVELLRLFAAARYNVVLVEWEDSFPWTVDERFRSPTAYSPDDVRRFARVAADLGLELIPLVQCLGHMETPLSVHGFEHLRELPDNESSLNPIDPGSRQLVQQMVDDVLSLMPDVTHFHLGGDESWIFGKSPQTAEYIAAHGKGALYLLHVEPILDRLVSSGIRPILWHDMMVEWDDAALVRLGQKCDLMTWGYAGHPDNGNGHCRTEYFKRFKANGISLWGATAYKGAEHLNERHGADRPVLSERQENALAWMEIANRLNYVGVIATAWSRWNTSAIQCVPIDAALDALVLLGVILHDGALPAGGVDACIDALDSLGEKARFVACRAAMRRLTNVRREGWLHVQYVREQITLARLDKRRTSASSASTGMKCVSQLENFVKESDSVANEVRASLHGLLEAVWIEEYLATRLLPLREEYETLRRDAFQS